MNKKLKILTEEEIEIRLKIDIMIENKAIDFINYKNEMEHQIKICEEQIKKYQEKIEEYKFNIESESNRLKNDIEISLKSNHIDMRETKTQRVYQTPSIKYIHKLPKQEIKLMDNVDAYEVPVDFIEMKEKILWNEFKKTLFIENGKVLSKETGEIIDVCEIIEKDEKVEVKIL
jgi:hypothetical protein